MSMTRAYSLSHYSAGCKSQNGACHGIMVISGKAAVESGSILASTSNSISDETGYPWPSMTVAAGWPRNASPLTDIIDRMMV